MKATHNKQTRLCLSVGSIRLCLFSDMTLEMRQGSRAFRSQDIRIHSYSQHNSAKVPVQVRFVDEFPSVTGILCGEDDIFSFYRDDSRYFQLARPGLDGSVSLAAYPEDFRRITLYVNESSFPGVVRTADKVLQLLPMKHLLSHFMIFMLHSSRISVNGRAILFTAPSGTGKTTQARLWQMYGGAEIAGNDRTLLWKEKGLIMTGGYPVDGSAPVYSSERIPLGAVVLLRQSPENRVRRLPASLVLRFLMEQTALDAWNAGERVAAQLFWLELTEFCPVYQLECRPDADAVRCLNDRLEKDEVFSCGFDS